MSLTPQRYRKTEGIHRVGLAADKPDPTTVLAGTLYFSTDTATLERSDGTTWDVYTGSGELAANRLLGRGDTGDGPVEALTISNSLIMTGTELTVRSGVFNYTYNQSVVEPPAAGQVRLDAVYPWTQATKVWMRFVSADGQDLYWGIMLITEGATLLIQDKDDHMRYVRLTTTGAPIDKGLYAEFPVVWQANGSTINTASQIFVRVAGTIMSPLLQPQLDALAARIAALEGA